MSGTVGRQPFECYYGQSGTGKSEAIVAVIKRLWHETGKKFRVLVGDGSAATYEALVSAGVVEIADYTIREWPLSTMTQICQGYWPQDVLDPKSKLVALTQEQFASFAGYAIEGLSVGSGYIMGDKKGGFAEQASRGVRIGGDNPVKLVDLELDAAGNPKAGTGPGLAFGGVTLGGFGQAQRRMLGFIEHSKGLPGWVIWTAHEKMGEDKASNTKVIGPEVAGGALTAGLSKHFNNTLHFAIAQKSVKVKDQHTEKSVDEIDAEYRIYTRDHFRAEGNSFTQYRAVCRTPLPNGWPTGETDVKTKKPLVVGAMPLYFESDQPGKSIIDFYENVKLARLQSIADLKPADAA